MDEHERLAQRFETHRPHPGAVAYRLLGSLSEADDAVQEAWLHLSRGDTSGVENLGGWLTTVVARICLDMLRSRNSRREEPLGVHVPDPIVSRADGWKFAERVYEVIYLNTTPLAGSAPHAARAPANPALKLLR